MAVQSEAARQRSATPFWYDQRARGVDVPGPGAGRCSSSSRSSSSYNTAQNLQRRGIASGFGFLGNDRRLRHQLLADPVQGRRTPTGASARRHPQHPVGRGDRHRPGDGPGLRHRHRAAVEELAGRAARDGLRRNAPQHSAAAADSSSGTSRCWRPCRASPEHVCGSVRSRSTSAASTCPRRCSNRDSGWVLAALVGGDRGARSLSARWARRGASEPASRSRLFRVGLADHRAAACPRRAGCSARRGPGSIRSLQGFNFKGGRCCCPEFVALLFAPVALYRRFIAEIVRGGILAVSHGQTEAAHGARPEAAGMMLRLVILPQALRVIIPPLTSQYLNLTKNSSLAVAIGYPGPRRGLRRHDAQPDRPGGRGDRHHHAGLPDHQPVDLGVHELVQPPHRAGGAVGMAATERTPVHAGTHPPAAAADA